MGVDDPVGEGVSVAVKVSEGVKVLVKVNVAVGGLGVAVDPPGGGGGLINLEMRNFSTIPLCADTRWVISQVVSAESPNRLNNFKKGVMKGWLKSTMISTSSPGAPAFSVD